MQRYPVGELHGERGYEIGGGAVNVGQQRVGTRADEPLRRVHHLRCERRHHDPAHERVTGRVELAQEPVFGRNLHAGRLHSRRVRERLGITQYVATLRVTGHVLHAVDDLHDRAFAPHTSEERPRCFGGTGVERVVHDSDPRGRFGMHGPPVTSLGAFPRNPPQEYGPYNDEFIVIHAGNAPIHRAGIQCAGIQCAGIESGAAR